MKQEEKFLKKKKIDFTSKNKPFINETKRNISKSDTMQLLK